MYRLLLQLTIAVFLLLLLSACHRKTCPAYQSTFLLGKGDAEEFFSYFSALDSLPKDSGLFRSRGKTKNGLVRRKGAPNVWAFLGGKSYEPRHTFPKVISTKNYVLDTAGMVPPSSAEALAGEDLIASTKKDKPQKERRKKEPTPALSEDDGGLMGEGRVADDFEDGMNVPTPTRKPVPIADESTGKIIAVAADSVAKDSVEVVLKFSDQVTYEALFGDPAEQLAEEKKQRKEMLEQIHQERMANGGKKIKKKKKDRKKNELFPEPPAEKKEDTPPDDDARKEETDDDN